MRNKNLDNIAKKLKICSISSMDRDSDKESVINFRNRQFSKGEISVSYGSDTEKIVRNLSCIATSAITNSEYGRYHSSFSESKRCVYYFDTVHSIDHCTIIYDSILSQANIPKGKNDPNFNFIQLSFMSVDERKDMIEYVLRKMCDTGLVIIDSISELLYNPNNITECQQLVDWLIKKAKLYDAHVHVAFPHDLSEHFVGSCLWKKGECLIDTSIDMVLPSSRVR